MVVAEAEIVCVGGDGGGCCGDVRSQAEQPEQLCSLLVSSWVVVMSSSDMLAKPNVSQKSSSSESASFLSSSSESVFASFSSSSSILSAWLYTLYQMLFSMSCFQTSESESWSLSTVGGW